MRTTRATRTVFVVLALTCAAGPSFAAEALSAERRYTDCMARTETDPHAALRDASAWEAADGGIAAGHCAATALMALDRAADAARKLEFLARQSAKRYSPGLQADLFAQSGRAWLAAGMSVAAERVLDQALSLSPDRVEAHIDRGLARAGQRKYWGALEDFNRALALDPKRPDVLVLRAAAHREVDALDLAQDDLTSALKLAPRRPDALLELGNLLAQKGDIAGARDAWRAVLVVAPEGPEGDAARGHLARQAN